MTRLAERVAATIVDIDKFVDAEVDDKDKTIMKYHLYLVEDVLRDLIDS